MQFGTSSSPPWIFDKGFPLRYAWGEERFPGQLTTVFRPVGGAGAVPAGTLNATPLTAVPLCCWLTQDGGAPLDVFNSMAIPALLSMKFTDEVLAVVASG